MLCDRIWERLGRQIMMMTWRTISIRVLKRTGSRMFNNLKRKRIQMASTTIRSNHDHRMWILLVNGQKLLIG